MQKVRSLRATVAGRTIQLSADAVERALRTVQPEPVRDHFVVVSGTRYPPKQVIAAVTRLDRSDFTTNQARSLLRRLGFTTGRRSTSPRGLDTSATTVASVDDVLAGRLRPHRGRWIALEDNDVLIAADSPEEVLSWLTRHDKRADTMFRVPLDPSIDLGGFPG